MSFCVLAIRCKLSIHYEEEVYMDYGSLFDFSGGQCKEKQLIRFVVWVGVETLGFKEPITWRELGRK